MKIILDIATWLFFAIAAILLFMWVMQEPVSAAMHAETLNQRRIASKVIRHLPGYAEYKQFTETNHE